MYSSISIEGFRCFPRFELPGLDRINLLVGANNSGKTALLEAIALLASEGQPRAIADAALRRGEIVHGEDGSARADVRRLFHGHTMGSRIVLKMSGRSSNDDQHLVLRVARFAKDRRTFDEDGHEGFREVYREESDSGHAPRYLVRDYEASGRRTHVKGRSIQKAASSGLRPRTAPFAAESSASCPRALCPAMPSNSECSTPRALGVERSCDGSASCSASEGQPGMQRIVRHRGARTAFVRRGG